MGLTGLWMCLMVLSAVSCLHQLSCVDSSVTGYSSIRDVSRLLDQLIRPQRVSPSVVLECVFMYTSVTNNAARNGTGRAETLKNLGRLVSISMHHLLYWEMSVTNICLGGCCVFSCISLHNGGVASFGLLQCVIRLWLKVGKKGRRGKGPSVAQCPKLPTL